MLPAIGVSRARLSKSAPHNQQQTHQTKRILPVLNKPKKHHLQSAPPTGRLKKAPSGINLNGQPAMMSPKQRRVVISVHKTSTYNYTILPGNNTRVVMNSLRLRPWWRCNPKIIPTNHFIWEMFRNRNRYKSKKYRRVMLNHLQHNHGLVTKNGLYLSLKAYCSTAGIDLATIVPQTFYLSSVQGNDERNTELEEFVSYNNDSSCDGTDDIIWILKPAFAANQGCGIEVVTGLNECLAVIGCQQQNSSSNQKETRIDLKVSSDDDMEDNNDGEEEEESAPQEDGTESAPKQRRSTKITEWIVQRYMKQPLLVHGRKFDIRCFVLLVMKQSSSSKVLPDGSKEDCVLKAYFYKDGYVRTSGKKYNLNNLSDKETHLTNDAVQKKAASYGKYESANKLTYDQFQDTINKDYPSAPPGVVRSKILPQIEYQIKISIQAALSKLTTSFINKSFELLGYDFMVDANFESTLIEINSNPSLDQSGTVLEELIPHMVENTFQLSVDALISPPSMGNRSQRVQESIDNIQTLENRYIDLML